MKRPQRNDDHDLHRFHRFTTSRLEACIQKSPKETSDGQDERGDERQPTTTSCKEKEENGPGDGMYVHVTFVLICVLE